MQLYFVWNFRIFLNESVGRKFWGAKKIIIKNEEKAKIFRKQNTQVYHFFLIQKAAMCRAIGFLSYFSWISRAEILSRKTKKKKKQKKNSVSDFFISNH